MKTSGDIHLKVDEFLRVKHELLFMLLLFDNFKHSATTFLNEYFLEFILRDSLTFSTNINPTQCEIRDRWGLKDTYRETSQILNSALRTTLQKLKTKKVLGEYICMILLRSNEFNESLNQTMTWTGTSSKILCELALNDPGWNLTSPPLTEQKRQWDLFTDDELRISVRAIRVNTSIVILRQLTHTDTQRIPVQMTTQHVHVTGPNAASPTKTLLKWTMTVTWESCSRPPSTHMRD